MSRRTCSWRPGDNIRSQLRPVGPPPTPPASRADKNNLRLRRHDGKESVLQVGEKVAFEAGFL